MKKQCKPWIFISIAAITLFNLLCYFGIRAMWSGIIRYTFEPMPYILLAVLILTALTGVLFVINRRFPLWFAMWAGLVDVLFLGLDAYIISLTTEATHYFIREFLRGALFLGCIGVAALLCAALLRLGKCSHKWTKWLPSCALVLALAVGIFLRFDLSLFNRIDSTPVAYAVNDTYQIVFTTQAKGTAWVTVDGQEYNDTYAGYRETESRIHKISVPMEALDTAGSYTVHAKSMLLRGPYCALQGKTISENYSWRGINTED